MKFLRRTSKKISRLGRKRKKKQVWRRPSGRDNKMREKRKGYPVVVSVGYKNTKAERNKIDGKNVVRVMKLKDLEKIGKNDAILIGKIGKKKKMEIVKKAKESNLNILNVNIKKILKEKKNESK